MAKTIWNGDQVAREVREKSREAINEILQAAALDAERQHWYHARTPAGLEQNTIAEPAIMGRHIVAGRFGTTKRRGFYGLFLELRQGFLRPAADRWFPALPAVLAEKLRR